MLICFVFHILFNGLNSYSTESQKWTIQSVIIITPRAKSGDSRMQKSYFLQKMLLQYAVRQFLLAKTFKIITL